MLTSRVPPAISVPLGPMSGKRVKLRAQQVEPLGKGFALPPLLPLTAVREQDAWHSHCNLATITGTYEDVGAGGRESDSLIMTFEHWMIPRTVHLQVWWCVCACACEGWRGGRRMEEERERLYCWVISYS